MEFIFLVSGFKVKMFFYRKVRKAESVQSLSNFVFLNLPIDKNLGVAVNFIMEYQLLVSAVK
jgi:hypothetical protein